VPDVGPPTGDETGAEIRDRLREARADIEELSPAACGS